MRDDETRDSRMVRISRALGGKDRHSKVCTVRGLRDRRVRLSVATAIQLYDLQERLGFNQPSKVVDWLLNCAKNEIDELPPLQIPPGFSFGPNLEPNKQSLNTSLGENKNVRNDHEKWARNEDENPSSLMNYSSFVGSWDSSNLTQSHPSRGHGSTAQNEDSYKFSVVQLPAAHDHDLVYEQPGISSQSYFRNNSQISEFGPKK